MKSVTRRNFLGSVVGGAVAASVSRSLRGQAASAPAIGRSSRRPNVLLIMSDDMRAELSSYNSYFGAKTPNLDALGKSGVRFDRNYCQFPICNPSRASMMTGHPATATGVLGNRDNFRLKHPEFVSLPQLFRENGYKSIRVGKIFHGGIDDPKAWTEGGGAREGDGGSGGKDLPLKRVESPASAPSNVLPPLPQDTSQAAHSDRIVVLDGMGEGHPDFRTADRTIEYLEQLKNEPFFIGCGFVKPHSPLCAPQEFLDLYDEDKIQLTPDFAPWPTVPPGFPDAAIRKRNADLFIGRPASVEGAKQMIRAYIASISWCDWNVGRVIAALDRLGLRDNTIIVFAVDHGYQLGEKGKWSKAGSLFENGTRTPFIIAAPGMRGNGTACYRIVESLDLYRTVVELTGLPLPEGIEGQSLVPLLNNPTAEWDKPAYSVWSEDSRTLHGVAVRTEQWRFAEYGPEGKNGAMLFDVKKDPLELTNLADKPEMAQVREQLSALTRKYAARLG